MIATGLGVLVLGGVLVANSGRSASAQSSLAGPAIVSQAEANRTTLVNCGEGRQALVYSDPRTGGSQVQCVADPSAVASNLMPGVAGAMPVSQFVPAIVSPTERVVYRDPVVPAARSTRPAVRRTSYGTSPSYSRASEVPAKQPRTWKKSALIIGGSTAAGAGVGAIMGGGSGAKKGAVVGLVGGTIYDIATRNK